MLQLRPTFSESWYRVVNLRARLRPSAQISRQYYRGERWYVVRDPAGNQYHRLSDAAYRFVGLLDGSRTVGEAWDLVGGTLDDEAPTQPEVIQILSQLHAANLLESDLTADSNVLLRRHKKQLKRKMQGRLMNILFPRIPLWDPDRVLKRWMPVARWVMSPIGALVWLAVVATAVVLMVPRWGGFMRAYQEALSIGANPEKAFYLFVVFWLLKFCHEMGHAFACRRFGGECHEMGLMLLVFIPTPYVDASSAWAFPSRWQRMFVGAGGMVVELFLAAIAAFIWMNTTPGVPIMGLPINELACDAIMIAGFTTVIFNANPLLRYDGYYMLSDWLEIPNLQQKSKDYLLGLIKRHVFRVKSQQPLPPVSQRLWLFFYGIASTCYRIFVGIMIILLVAWQVPVLGVLMALGGIATWLIVPWVKTFKYLALEPELHRKRGRATAFVVVVAVLAFILIGRIPFNVYVDAKGVLEPVAKEVVNAEQGGFVADIRARDAQWVKKGDVLLVLSDPELQTKIKKLEASLRGLTLKEQQSRGSGDMAQAMIDLIDIETFTHQLTEARRQQAELVVRAPIDGQVIAPELKFLPGKFVPRGTELLRVETNDKLVVRTVVEQREVALARRLQSNDGTLKLAKDPEIRLVSDQGTTLKGGQARLIRGATQRLPSRSLTVAGGGDIVSDPRDQQGEFAQTPQHEMKVALPNPGNVFTSGQRAWVRLTVDKKPLIWTWANRFYQLIEAKNQESQWFQT
ncbi:MAG TPA: efflux RND transporter periplasmic adaptor subunit [Tepidisphaeraceae bacterium]|nr:efflux RND transporter periplasmic adaptor subunit [Tepidisphaeraceae bacterium]